MQVNFRILRPRMLRSLATIVLVVLCSIPITGTKIRRHFCQCKLDSRGNWVREKLQTYILLKGVGARNFPLSRHWRSCLRIRGGGPGARRNYQGVRKKLDCPGKGKKSNISSGKSTLGKREGDDVRVIDSRARSSTRPVKVPHKDVANHVGQETAHQKAPLLQDSDDSSGVLRDDDSTSIPIEGEPFFDGFQQCNPINMSDTAEVNRLLDDLNTEVQDMGNSWKDFFAKFRQLKKDKALDDYDDDDRPRSPAEKIVRMQIEMLFTYHVLITRYFMLKLQGKWTRDHRVAFQLQDIVMLLDQAFHAEEVYAEEIKEYLEEAQEHESDMSSNCKPETHPGIGRRQGAGMIHEHISKENLIKGNDSLDGDETGGGGDGSQSTLASEGSESYPSDLGEGGEGSVDRWQKLLWKAIKMEHELKNGTRKKTRRAVEFVARKAYFESKWSGAHDLPGGDYKESSHVQIKAVGLRNRFDDL